MQNQRDHFKDVLFGVATGDAFGVPFEFRSKAQMLTQPATEMIGFGSHHQPAGTWSDDSSLTFCLAEALTKEEFDLRTLSVYFQNWLYDKFWTPHGRVFDVGMTTRAAINRYASSLAPELAGGYTEDSNGNGSLMRILPLLFYVKDMNADERFDITNKVSSMTHGHIRSVIACYYYLEFARLILRGTDKFEIYHHLQLSLPEFLKAKSVPEKEIGLFYRLLSGKIYEVEERKIFGSGYVLHSLEASVWCLLKTDNYRDAVLKAVNLGDDTDTTGAITGGLAGLLYGYETIPSDWLNQLARKNDVEELAGRMRERFGGGNRFSVTDRLWSSQL